MSELQALLEEITKEKGEGVSFKASKVPAVPHIPTGIFLLDLALVGGIPEGLACMPYGMESSGKSTLCWMVVANMQKKYPKDYAALVDAENTFDPAWAAKHGVDLERLIVSQPRSGNEGVDLAIGFMGVLEVRMIVGDSIPAFVPKAVIEKSAEDDTMGALAALMGKFCSKMLMSWSEERMRDHRVTAMLVNQFREKLGFVMGDKRSIPGGKQLQYFVTTKIELKNKEVMGKDKFGMECVERNEHSFKITKAKVGASIRAGQYDIIINRDNEHGFEMGEVDDVPTVITYAKMMGFITGGGQKWTLDDLKGDEDRGKGWQNVFKKQDEIVAYYRAKKNRKELLWLKQVMIAMQRSEKGLATIPPDGFLLGWLSKEEQYILTKAFPTRDIKPHIIDDALVPVDDDEEGETAPAAPTPRTRRRA